MAWFPFKHQPSADAWMPYIWGRLEFNGRKTDRSEFLVDTGSAWNIAPSFHAARLGLVGEPVPLPLKGANGKPLVGFVERVVISIEGLEPFEDRVAFCRDAAFWLLGNRGFFDRTWTRFHNVPDATRGRRFCLELADTRTSGGPAR